MMGACSTLAQAFRNWCLRPAETLMLVKGLTTAIFDAGAQKDSLAYA